MPEHPALAAAPAPASAAAITKAASRQSYLTIRWLADRAYRDDAFAIYAYFRWLDDTIDERLADRDVRLAFVARQREILARVAGGGTDADLSSLGVGPEEALLVGLARPDPTRDAATGPAAGPTEPTIGLLLSLRSMLDVMEFDARRRGRPVTQDELDAYTHDLAVSVTEALHHCIGHGCGCPRDESRYVAVTGAHVAHMLRDLAEDVAAGYLNLPAGLLPDDAVAGALPQDALLDLLHSPAVRAWVRDRVGLARDCFATGRQYLARVESARCRLAGHAYVARFEWVLDTIERDGYALRAAYPERATWRGGLAIAADGARSAVAGRKDRRQRARRLRSTAAQVEDAPAREDAR